MEAGGQKSDNKAQVVDIEEAASHPAREMSLHLLRMLETRMEAAGIVLQSESQRLLSRLQLHLLAAAAGFIAIWGGIVLLAIALPPNLRVPVLSGVILAFVATAVWAVMRAKRMLAGTEVGSLNWFLDSLKLDLEVLARSLSQPQPQVPSQPEPEPEPEPQPERSQVSDAA
jgi:uncharacterized membrane protein YqjE